MTKGTLPEFSEGNGKHRIRAHRTRGEQRRPERVDQIALGADRPSAAPLQIQ